jgi:hypothetical protein
VGEDSEEMRDRLSAARDLLRKGRHEEATAEFEWLWDNIDRIDPGMEGVRVSFMAKTIEDLVGKHPPARLRFTEIRERTAMLAGADVTGTARLRFDWIVLNEILAERERTLAWFDSVKDDERYATVLDRVAARLVPLLRSHNRFREIGRLYKDPVATLIKTHRNFNVCADPDPGPDPDISPVVRRLMRQVLQKVLDDLPKHVIEEAALMVTCLLAAGRTAEADAVEREARRLDPSEAMRAALEKARGRLD